MDDDAAKTFISEHVSNLLYNENCYRYGFPDNIGICIFTFGQNSAGYLNGLLYFYQTEF